MASLPTPLPLPACSGAAASHKYYFLTTILYAFIILKFYSFTIKQINMKEKEDWEHYLATLDEADRADPFKVIEAFAEQDTAFERRKAVFEIFSAAMGGEGLEADTPFQKSGRMWLLGMLMKLIEACYLIDDLRESKRLVYVIQPED